MIISNIVFLFLHRQDDEEHDEVKELQQRYRYKKREETKNDLRY